MSFAVICTILAGSGLPGLAQYCYILVVKSEVVHSSEDSALEFETTIR
jgi:hypothetical protein